MKIVTVEYRRLHSFGDYSNETVGAVAEIGEHQTPEDALGELRTWVTMQLSHSGEIRTLQGEINELRWKKENLERQFETAGRKWEAMMAFLEKLGIQRPAEIPATIEELPF